jgi:hypothetical protein
MHNDSQATASRPFSAAGGAGLRRGKRVCVLPLLPEARRRSLIGTGGNIAAQQKIRGDVNPGAEDQLRKRWLIPL